jgi:hypothetical protein
MRTTLTLDDDLARRLREEARRSGRPFKDVVNEAIRRGLASGEGGGRPRRFRVKPSACGFRAGVDLGRLNQLADEIELERAAALVIRDR